MDNLEWNLKLYGDFHAGVSSGCGFAQLSKIGPYDDDYHMIRKGVAKIPC